MRPELETHPLHLSVEETGKVMDDAIVRIAFDNFIVNQGEFAP
jgi:hypothetical protein